MVSDEAAVEQTQRAGQGVSGDGQQQEAHWNVRGAAEEGEGERQRDTRLILPDVDASL